MKRAFSTLCVKCGVEAYAGYYINDTLLNPKGVVVTCCDSGLGVKPYCLECCPRKCTKSSAG
jgi:hypothetical protein